MLHGSGLAGAVGGADDVDTGEGEEQDVGRFGQAAGELAFQGLNFLGFALAIVLPGQGDPPVLAGGDLARGGLFGPGADGLDGAALAADARFPEGLT
jgi:hypothetical protein